MRICKAIAAWLALLVILLLPLGGCAQEEDEMIVTMGVLYRDGSTALVGAQFDLYRVADMDEKGDMTLTQTFRQYPINVADIDEGQLSMLASTISSYVHRDQIIPQESQKTNRFGMIFFPESGESLDPGLYLVIGRDHHQGGYEYRSLPVLLSLPYQVDGEWIAEAVVRPKWEKEEEGQESEKLRRKVLKVWKGVSNQEERPLSVTVQLLEDGKIFDEQVLSAQNNWGYEWENLDGDKEWLLTEVPVSGYSVTIRQEGITFVVTNTYDEKFVTPTPPPGETTPPPGETTPPPGETTPPPGETTPPPGETTPPPGETTPPPGETTPPPDEPTPTPTLSPTATPTPKPTPRPTRTPRPHRPRDPSILPQTGQVWWPVPVLSGAGLLLILLGLLIRRGERDEE